METHSLRLNQKFNFNNKKEFKWWYLAWMHNITPKKTWIIKQKF